MKSGYMANWLECGSMTSAKKQPKRLPVKQRTPKRSRAMVHDELEHPLYQPRSKSARLLGPKEAKALDELVDLKWQRRKAARRS